MKAVRQVSLVVRASIATLVAALCGCDGPFCPSRQVEIEHWDFERDCHNDLCGLSVTHGRADRFEVFSSGEHALHLAPGTTLEQNISAPASSFIAPSVTVTSRCYNGARLAIRATEVMTSNFFDGGFVDFDGGTTTSTTMSEATATIEGSTEWQTRSPSLVSDDPNILNGFPTDSRITHFELDVVGDGGCDIDDLILTTTSGFCD